jgi:hypothetical protein
MVEGIIESIFSIAIRRSRKGCTFTPLPADLLCLVNAFGNDFVDRGCNSSLSFNYTPVALISTAGAGADSSLTMYKSNRLLGAVMMLVGAVSAAFACLPHAEEPSERKPWGMANNYNTVLWPGQDRPRNNSR